MKIAVYSYRKDEEKYLKIFEQKYNVELVWCKGAPTMETAIQAEGCDGISIITTPMNEELIRRFYGLGIRFISTRSIGYDHIDIEAAKKAGMHIGNVSYSPVSVADYAVMLMLMATRKIKAISLRSAMQDFSLDGVQGIEMHNLTIGVAGTGRIGRTVLRRLSGFDCKLLAYDLYENEEAKKYAEYVPFDEFLSRCDMISLHMPATDENYHLLNRDSFARMKEGAFLINTARGSLVDSEALIDAVESGKISGAALDVVENEAGLYYNNKKNHIIKNHELAILKSFPNVIVLPHTAFYTDQAVSDMVEHSLQSLVLFQQGKENPWQVV